MIIFIHGRKKDQKFCGCLVPVLFGVCDIIQLHLTPVTAWTIRVSIPNYNQIRGLIPVLLFSPRCIYTFACLVRTHSSSLHTNPRIRLPSLVRIIRTFTSSSVISVMRNVIFSPQVIYHPTSMVRFLLSETNLPAVRFADIRIGRLSSSLIGLFTGKRHVLAEPTRFLYLSLNIQPSLCRNEIAALALS